MSAKFSPTASWRTSACPGPGSPTGRARAADWKAAIRPRPVTAPDVPELTKTAEIPAPSTMIPGGQKGAGESGTGPVPAAIGNAVFDATGVRFTQLPITPQRMLTALREKQRRGVETLRYPDDMPDFTGPREHADWPAPTGADDVDFDFDWDGEDWDADDPVIKAKLAAWEDDWERRLAAGEFDDPDPMPDDIWRASAEERLASGEIDLELDRTLHEAQQRWWAEFEAGRIRDPLDDQPPPTPPDPEPGVPLPTAGWWAAVDRAYDEAGRAVLDARIAIGRASAAVDVAARADANDEAVSRESTAGRVDAAEDALGALAAAADTDRQALADLLARGAGTGLADRPRIALVDALSGALVSLTDLPALRRTAHCGRPACRRRPDRCTHDLTNRPALGAPPPTDGYRAGAALDRFIRARDRRCRFPGCRNPVSKGELDHRVAWPHGPTDVTNLAGFCTADHRAKHQALGLTVDIADDATILEVTTPSDITVTTEPPPF